MPTLCTLSSGRTKLFTGKIKFLTIHGQIGQERVKRDTAKLDKHNESAAES